MTAGRLEADSAAIDRANADDPRREGIGAETLPYEVLYSRRMEEWVRLLAPGASEELLLAARAQHVRRWTVPRSTYPEGRSGYLGWRESLKKFHADELARIMGESGYDGASVGKARALLLKKNLAADPEGQTLEDAACLVFLRDEFAAFSGKTEESKVVDILRKTWGKMSARAREEALKLEFGPAEQARIAKALGEPSL